MSIELALSLIGASIIVTVLACRLCSINKDCDEHEDLNEPK